MPATPNPQPTSSILDSIDLAEQFRSGASSAAFGTSLILGPGAMAGIEGISVGHATSGDTGVTVIAAPGGAVAAVDVRGGGPGTRETDLLAPENTVERAHAIVLSGGSAFGLATADGVMRELAERGIGFEVTPARPDVIVPIVPGAVIFDLLLGEPTIPSAELGRRALNSALDDAPGAPGAPGAPDGPVSSAPSGSVGAGTAAMAGAIKGGFGQARVAAGDDGYWVAALMVVNSFGAVIDSSGRAYGLPALPPVSEASLATLDKVFVGRTKVLAEPGPGGAASASVRNTTIGCLMTNAPLTTAQLKRVAMCGHDGLARAVRPAHAPMDGDTLFALSTAGLGADAGATTVGADTVALLTAMAADAVQFAIVDAITSATSRGGVPALRDLI